MVSQRCAFIVAPEQFALLQFGNNEPHEILQAARNVRRLQHEAIASAGAEPLFQLVGDIGAGAEEFPQWPHAVLLASLSQRQSAPLGHFGDFFVVPLHAWHVECRQHAVLRKLREVDIEVIRQRRKARQRVRKFVDKLALSSAMAFVSATIGTMPGRIFIWSGSRPALAARAFMSQIKSFPELNGGGVAKKISAQRGGKARPGMGGPAWKKDGRACREALEIERPAKLKPFPARTMGFQKIRTANCG